MEKKLLFFLLIIFSLNGFLFAQNTYVLDLSAKHYFHVDDNANNDLDVTGDFTIEAWVKCNDFNGRVCDRSGVLKVYATSSSIRFDLDGGGSISTGTVNTAVWNHVAVSRSGSTTRIFLNGEEKASSDLALVASTEPFYVGGQDTWFGAWDAQIDEFRFSNIARYTSNFSPSTSDAPFTSDANTILLYHFDDNTEFPPGNSSGFTFTHINNGVDANDYVPHVDLPLPVELTSFSSIPGDGQVTLKWQTASEVNNQGFEVQRSMEKKGDFQVVDSYVSNPALKGAGNSSTTKNYLFTDNSVLNGTIYWYKIVDTDLNGVRTEHGPIYAMPHTNSVDLNPIQGDLPETFVLQQNYPNPFNPNTTIRFDIPDMKTGLVHANLTVYDITGKKIRTLLNGELPPGPYQIEWNGISDAGQVVPTGIYIYSFRSDKFSSSKKMILKK